MRFRFLAGISFVSTATLCLEISLIRFFSVSQQYHFAFLVVSIAFLGYGASGSYLSLLKNIQHRAQESFLSKTALIFSISIPLSTFAANAIPFDIVNAAKVDGATTWQVTRYIILPLLKWPVMFMTAWHLISHLNSYIYILLLTDGGPYYRSEVWALYGLHQSFDYYDFGYGAAIAMLLVSVSVFLTLTIWKIFGFQRLMEPSRIEA